MSVLTVDFWLHCRHFEFCLCVDLYSVYVVSESVADAFRAKDSLEPGTERSAPPLGQHTPCVGCSLLTRTCLGIPAVQLDSDPILLPVPAAHESAGAGNSPVLSHSNLVLPAHMANGESWVGFLCSELPPFHSPLNLKAWSLLLQGHPQSATVDSILEGIRHGVRLGYDGPFPSTRCSNHLSTAKHSADVQSNIASEVSAGRVAGPFAEAPFPRFRTSPMGAVPKKDSVKVRRIHDLTAPKGNGVNAFIADGKVSYSRFDDAVDMVRNLGSGCWLWKTDLADAFRHITVHRNDVPLLGFVWAGLLFFDLVLPFGLRSSPRLFELFATALQWILTNKFGLHFLVHYLDDFFGRRITRKFATGSCSVQRFPSRLSVTWPDHQHGQGL